MAPRKGNQPASWEVDADKPAPTGETRARRSYCVQDLITSPAPGIETMHDLILYAARTHGSKAATATRPVVRTIDEQKEVDKGDGKKEMKTWTYYELGPYETQSYETLLDRVKAVGSGLNELGVGGEGEEGVFFNIYGATSANWQLVAQSCAFIAVPICTAYDSLGPSGLSHSLSEPGVRAMFTNAELLPTVLKVLDETPTVRLIVYDGEPKSSVLEDIRAKRGGDVKVMSLSEVEALGRKHLIEAKRAQPKDVFCCMYTSGSTGAPKGVLLTHANIIAAVGAIWHLLYEYLTPEDTFLAFLPLAHILEFIVEASFIFAGITCGYGKIKTLTDTSVRNCKGDIAEFKPSIMIGVPAVWELIRKGIMAKVSKSGAVKKAVFNRALRIKQFATDYSIPGLAGLTDAVVFNAVKAQTGGRLKIAFSGGGSLSATTQEFVNNSVAQLIQGYGLTESVAMCAILHPQFYNYGVAGCPVPSTEIKLVDCKDAGYLSTNDPPQGEIFLRGPSITQGYFKRPDLDKESFTSDGWFKTGDVGQWNKDGTLSIIDRIKNLVKLSDGEYIAIDRLESIYKGSMVCANGCLLANPHHRQPAMIVAVNPAHIVSFARDHGVGGGSEHAEQLVKDDGVREAVLKDLNAIGKKAGFKTMELLEAVILTADEWVPGKQLTAANKVVRKEVESMYKDDIKAHYA